MNNKLRTQVISSALVMCLAVSGFSASYASVDDKVSERPRQERRDESKKENGEDEKGKAGYSVEQAMSDRAQLSTIAFSGLAFITGSDGADTFMPPGKVADFFGFQYMRDVDVAGYGHNTQFLTRVANNILYILDDEQKDKLVALAVEQAPMYKSFAYNRFPLMEAFRDSLNNDLPQGSEGLSIENVGEYTAALYDIDAELSYNRAVVLGEIIESFTEEQLAYLSDMSFDDFNTWPDVEEDEALKQDMQHTEFVAVMTYASELFSWYKGSLEADVYFCPERHGTYFGGFFMKDYPAMNNPDYFISTAITGDKGQLFLEILDNDQRSLIESIIEDQREALNEIKELRTLISTELRKAQVGDEVDKEKVFSWIEKYGQLDGEMSALYAKRFSQVNETLTSTQREALVELRDLDVVPDGSYMFSTPVTTPELPNVDYLFGIGEAADDLAAYDTPNEFLEIKEERKKPVIENVNIQGAIGSVPLKAIEGQKPPKPEVDGQLGGGERPPRPEDGERPPRPEDGERPPRPEDGERPPRSEDGEKPPKPEDGVRPPRPEDDEQAPKPEDENTEE